MTKAKRLKIIYNLYKEKKIWKTVYDRLMANLELELGLDY
jgi:hypothetical protein